MSTRETPQSCVENLVRGVEGVSNQYCLSYGSFSRKEARSRVLAHFKAYGQCNPDARYRIRLGLLDCRGGSDASQFRCAQNLATKEYNEILRTTKRHT